MQRAWLNTAQGQAHGRMHAFRGGRPWQPSHLAEARRAVLVLRLDQLQLRAQAHELVVAPRQPLDASLQRATLALMLLPGRCVCGGVGGRSGREQVGEGKHGVSVKSMFPHAVPCQLMHYGSWPICAWLAHACAPGFSHLAPQSFG